jgi:hypothetical protein
MERDVAEEFLSIQQQNKLKMHEGLTKYILPLLAAIAAFFLDWYDDLQHHIRNLQHRIRFL